MDLNKRIEYDLGHLVESDVDPDPVRQLRIWLDEAESGGVEEPNAMVLSTVGATGRPASRNVLLRGLDDRGVFSFYTNRDSHKGHEIASNPNVCLLFTWLELRRQVRVSGYASLMSDHDSDVYFAQRPREAQIGAWASPQSEVLRDRAELEERVAEVHARFGDGDIPRPPFWGGYLVRSTSYEFWQGRSSRLHDRLHFWRQGDGWQLERLAP
ncbi:MAG TPA: pyridoxamine 5'-phosphate oxidase [Microthrixaceae bacterium]|nr:pyridoxamine 5'-phosphate oxidase [Microthrixaceae bacterium]